MLKVIRSRSTLAVIDTLYPNVLHIVRQIQLIDNNKSINQLKIFHLPKLIDKL